MLKKKHKAIKVLQIRDLKGYLSKHSKNEESTKEEGQTLEEYVKDRNFLETKDVYNITLNICETIANLNSLNCSVMYNQLNPANIMVTENNKIYIKDFPFSKSLQVNVEEDIYAIGRLMYFMASGKVPITMLEPLLEDSYGNNIDSNLKMIIQKCFDIDTKRRYVSIEELNKEIIIQLLIKSKYRKTEALSSYRVDSGKPLEQNRLKRVNKRKSKVNLGSSLSRVSAALSAILFT